MSELVERVARAIFDHEQKLSQETSCPMDETFWRDFKEEWIAKAEAAIAALTPPEGVDERYGWVIEHRDSEPSWPLYWTGKNTYNLDECWSRDHMDAVRFCREKDADVMRLILGGAPSCHRIAEHGWNAARSSGSDELSEDAAIEIMAKAMCEEFIKNPESAVVVQVTMNRCAKRAYRALQSAKGK